MCTATLQAEPGQIYAIQCCELASARRKTNTALKLLAPLPWICSSDDNTVVSYEMHTSYYASTKICTR